MRLKTVQQRSPIPHLAYVLCRLPPSLSIVGVSVCFFVLPAHPPIYLAFLSFFYTLVLNRTSLV